MTWPHVIELLRHTDALAWAALLALWHTSLLAMSVWAFVHSGRGLSPSRRHAAALGALVAAALLLGASWWGLQSWSTSPSLPPAVGLSTQPASHEDPGAQPASALNNVSSSVSLQSKAVTSVVTILSPALPWISGGWLIGVLVSAVRLAGGLLLTWRIRRRATPLASGPMADAISQLARQRGLQKYVSVAVSDDVNAPAVAGWRRPVMLLPRDLNANLSHEQVEPVIVHELEHVRRGDAWLAIVHTVSSAMLFFAPGSQWLSRLVLEAREQRCDDAAVQVCGDPGTYASALGVLATRSSGTWLTAAMGQQAPSLAGRIKRVMRGEVMPVITPGKFVGLATGIALTIASGGILLAASFEQMASRQISPGPFPIQTAGVAAPQPGQVTSSRTVSFGFAEVQPGAPVNLIAVTANENYAFARVRLRNVSERQLAAMTFLAVVERRPDSGPAILTPSDAIPVTLAPGESGEFDISLLRFRDALDWQRTLSAGRLAFLGVFRVLFADGDAWMVRPPAGAVTADDVFHLGGPSLRRDSLADPSRPGTPAKFCLDDRGLKYSEGALVKLKGEETRARCTSGNWIEQKDSSGRPSVWVSVSTLDRERASVKVQANQYAGPPSAGVPAKALVGGAEAAVANFIVRAWWDGADVVVLLNAAMREGQEKHVSTFRLVVGESHEVTETERFGAARIVVAAAIETSSGIVR